MATVKFLTGSLAQFNSITPAADTLYFLDNGELYRGNVKYSGSKVSVVAAYPETMASDVLYINSTDKSMKFNNAEVEPSIVSSIVVDADAPENDTPADRLANVGAIKAYIASVIADLPEAVDYTVELTDETAGETEYSKQTLTQASIEGDDKTVGTIVVPKVTMTTDSSDSAVKKYTLKQGTTEIGTIDIPADMVVEDAEVTVVTDEQAGTEGYPATAGTYMKFTIANKDEFLWVDVADLCDAYTGQEVTDAGISVAVSDANVISATLVGKAVGSANIVDGAVGEDALADAAVTADKIAEGAVAEDNLTEELAQKINDAAPTWGTIGG